MKIWATEQLIPVDCDGTLLLWDEPITPENEADLVEFFDPYEGATKWVLPHKPHIKICKDRLARGAKLLIWSQSGYAWAAQTAKACGLDIYGDNVIVTSKPICIIDDLPASAWLSERINLSHASQYGKCAKTLASIVHK